MFVKFKAQTQIRAARGIVRLVQIRMKAGPVIARGNPQVLTESPAHFDPLRPLSLAVLVPLIHPQHADIPVLGDVIHDSATRQPGVIAVLLTRAQPSEYSPAPPAHHRAQVCIHTSPAHSPGCCPPAAMRRRSAPGSASCFPTAAPARCPDSACRARNCARAASSPDPAYAQPQPC